LQMVKSPQPIRPFQIIFENGTTALWQQPRWHLHWKSVAPTCQWTIYAQQNTS
jgi:hypothetical protein